MPHGPTREEVAALLHQQWAQDLLYLIMRAETCQSGVLIPQALVEKLSHVASLDYFKLPEDRKQPLRKKADAVLAVLGQ